MAAVGTIALDRAADDRQRLADALVRAGNGDSAALREVHEKTSAKLFGICLRILADNSEAEDVLQEVYLTVWRRGSSFDPARASPITWLATLARNRSIDRLRARPNIKAVDVEDAADVADGSRSAPELIDASNEAKRLDGCLGQLDGQHATAVRTAFFEGVTYETLAAQAGVPLGTMKSWVRRSLLKLRTCLER